MSVWGQRRPSLGPGDGEGAEPGRMTLRMPQYITGEHMGKITPCRPETDAGPGALCSGGPCPSLQPGTLGGREGPGGQAEGVEERGVSGEEGRDF